MIIKVKVTLEGQGHISRCQGHIKVKVKNLGSFQFYAAQTVKQAGGLHSTEMCSCFTCGLVFVEISC